MSYWSLTQHTPPAIEPVTLDEVRRHARVSNVSEDEQLDLLGFIATARGYLESQTRRSLITQSWELSIDTKFPDEIELLRPPIQSVTSITYLDADGVEQTLDPSAYRLSYRYGTGIITPAYGTVWPLVRKSLGTITVVYVAGYGDTANDVPFEFRTAIKQLATSMFDERAGGMIDWSGAEALVQSYRVLSFG